MGWWEYSKTLIVAPKPTGLVRPICLQASGDSMPDGVWTNLRVFWNEKASHVSSASQMEDEMDVRSGGKLVLFWCLFIWAAIAASNESQMNGPWWRHWELPVKGGSLQPATTSWDTSASKSPTLMLVRLSAHSPADNEGSFLNHRSS